MGAPQWHVENSAVPGRIQFGTAGPLRGQASDPRPGEQMDPSAEDAGGSPTALAQDPAAPETTAVAAAPGAAGPPPVAVPQQRGPAPAGGTPAPAGKGPAPSPSATSSPGPRPASPRRPTDGVAVAALVSGIVPAIPVTLILGPLALIRIGRSGARGRTLAITGLVLAGLWIVAAAIVAAAIITRPPPPKPVTLPRVFSLRAGQCLKIGRAHV